MTDILEEALADDGPATVVTLDHTVPDDLEVGDIVLFGSDPYSFLHKGEGGGPLIFKPELRGRGLLEITPTEYIRRTGCGEAMRPGRKPALIAAEAPSPAEDERAFQALPPKARKPADVKDLYADEFRRRIEAARDRGEAFSRNPTNAAIVRESVDAALAAAGKQPPALRSDRSILRWLERSEKRSRSAMANVHGNYLRAYDRRVPQRVLDVIALKIRETVQDLPHLGPTKIRHRVNDEIKRINREERLNLPLAKPGLVMNEYNRFDAWIRKAAVEGPHAADLEFGAVGKLTRPTRINQLWELDHHVVDLIPRLGTSPIGRMLSKAGLGRFGITVAVDVHSGYPMGFYPSFEDTGLLPALMCVAHGVQEKTYVGERFPHIAGALLGHGKPVKIRYDRAPEFVGRQMALALSRVGIGFELARPHVPDDKPYIERHLGTLAADFVSWLKGRTGPNPAKRGAADPLREASLDLDDFVALLHEYLITVYARRPQQGLDWDTPEQRWLRGLRSHKPRLLTPDEQARIDVLPSIEVEVNIRREGIRWKNKFYQSPALQRIRRTSGDHGARKQTPTPAVGRVSLRDVGTMYVSVPDAGRRREIAVPCTKPAAHGRTLWQDQVIEALLLQKRKDPASPVDYGEGFAALFKRSLGYMGVTLGGGGKPGPARAAATAARFVGALVDGVAHHALTRVERDADGLDLFGEVERRVAGHRPPPAQERSGIQAATIDLDSLGVDAIDLDELMDDGEED